MKERGFVKGHEKMGGRELGTKNKVNKHIFEEFLETIKEVEKDERISKGKTFFQHILERAYRNDAVAINILKKLIPDQTFNIDELRSKEPIVVRYELIDANKKPEEKVIDVTPSELIDVDISDNGEGEKDENNKG